jgi:hypothetical protein
MADKEGTERAKSAAVLRNEQIAVLDLELQRLIGKVKEQEALADIERRASGAASPEMRAILTECQLQVGITRSEIKRLRREGEAAKLEALAKQLGAQVVWSKKSKWKPGSNSEPPNAEPKSCTVDERERKRAHKKPFLESEAKSPKPRSAGMIRRLVEIVDRRQPPRQGPVADDNGPRPASLTGRLTNLCQYTPGSGSGTFAVPAGVAMVLKHGDSAIVEAIAAAASAELRERAVSGLVTDASVRPGTSNIGRGWPEVAEEADLPGPPTSLGHRSPFDAPPPVAEAPAPVEEPGRIRKRIVRRSTAIPVETGCGDQPCGQQADGSCDHVPCGRTSR